MDGWKEANGSEDKEPGMDKDELEDMMDKFPDKPGAQENLRKKAKRILEENKRKSHGTN